MKKITLLGIMVVCVIAFSPIVLAKNENTGNSNGDDAGVQNRNQVETQNMGEDQELIVRTAEQGENDELVNDVAMRGDKARENMSEVAAQVEVLLATRTLKGGIGDQVREIARAQNQDQDQTKLHLGNIEERKDLAKFLIGPDYKALKSLDKQIEQNQLRIDQLTEIKNQLTNQGDQMMVQEMIDALIQQNTSLQEVIASENQVRSMFGWLLKMFVR